MPLTAVEICAAALVKVGARPIASLEEAGLEAACAKRLYPIVRDALLVAHPWSFTLAHARLDPTPAPARGRLRPRLRAPGRPPAHALGRRRPERARPDLPHPGCPAAHRRRRGRGDRLPAAGGRGVVPRLFVQPLVTRLAAELCVPVTEGTARAAELAQLAELELRRARLLDSQQATPRRIEDFTLVEARYS
jgi:hypothetical protein